MTLPSIVVRTKLAPPRQHQYTLERPRLTQQLLAAQNYRLTILQAGTGYGKSTALAALKQETFPCIWYCLDKEDSDPQRFLLYLLHSFTIGLPHFRTQALALLEEVWATSSHSPWTAIIDTLINDLSTAFLTEDDSRFLILDDAHHLQQESESMRILDRLIALAPPQLHTILSCRTPLSFPSQLAWRVKGEILHLSQADLAFTPPEIDSLFRDYYGHALTLEQATLLVNRLEGWPIALHLVWQQLQQDGGVSFAEALQHLSGSTSDLFVYLTQEVLTKLPADIQAFLQLTAVLRQFTAADCNYLRQANDSDPILRYLLDQALFVVDLGDGHFRYHHLFRSWLYQQLPTDKAQAAHKRVATHYQAQGEIEEAIHHLLAATAFEETAQLLVTWGRTIVQQGRLDTLSTWIGSLPPPILATQPALLCYLGDIDRLRSRFDLALSWYQQAEEQCRRLGNIAGLGQALRGQARIYLDTVNPSQAEKLLQEALRLADGQVDRAGQARLIELLAENLLNQGRLDEAQSYQAQAQALRQEGPSQVELPVRMLLRTGRLDEARTLLQQQAAIERQTPVPHARSHRETLLLLSLILAFQGEQAAAYETAIEGTQRGQQLQSGFVMAVGYMRQGHAWALQRDEQGFAQAITCYRKAIHLSDRLDVPRLRVEADWGLCLAYGFQGELTAAYQTAEQGIKTAQIAGDEWIEACIRLAMGAGYVLAQEGKTAVDWLRQALSSFRNCADNYGEALTLLWQCLLWQQMKDEARLRRDIMILLPLCQTHHYEYLFTHPTFTGPPDISTLVPLLLFARDQTAVSHEATHLLQQLGLAGLKSHPGYQLRVQTLGNFCVWRGREEVPDRAWSRKKARQLFQLLLTYQGQYLHREQISDMLWPELSPEGAVRDFKIAYSAMCNTLEVNRRRNTPSAFVERQDVHYRLRPQADLWLDATHFEQSCHQALALAKTEPDKAVSLAQEALALYQGDYLQAFPYGDWCQQRRQQLRQLFLATAEYVAHYQLQQQQWEAVISLCHRILTYDNCWEAAYRLLILAHTGAGHRAQALQTYQQCRHTLQTELGVSPDPATTQVYEMSLT